MPRVRSRRARGLRFDWPLTAADELRQGVDLGAFRTKLGRLFAEWAKTPADLTKARQTEQRLVHLYPENEE